MTELLVVFRSEVQVWRDSLECYGICNTILPSGRNGRCPCLSWQITSKAMPCRFSDALVDTPGLVFPYLRTLQQADLNRADPPRAKPRS